jgi:pimeloyl-ACP methyl ester carboxylesterase
VLGSALLIPGYTGSKEDFAPILDPLGTVGYRVVAMDLPGQYQSPGPQRRDAYTMAWLGSVVNEVAAALGDGPVHLLGHSFGGLVGRAAVLAEPRRYRSLTLLGSGPAGIGGQRRELMARLEPVAAAGGLAAVWAAMDVETTEPPVLTQFRQTRFLASSLAGLFGMADALRSEPDLVAPLRETGVPTLVSFGTDDDAWSPAEQRDMAARLGGEPGVIEGAAHSPTTERPATTAAMLATFWASLHHRVGPREVPVDAAGERSDLGRRAQPDRVAQRDHRAR